MGSCEMFAYVSECISLNSWHVFSPASQTQTARAHITNSELLVMRSSRSRAAARVCKVCDAVVTRDDTMRSTSKAMCVCVCVLWWRQKPT